MKRYRIVILSGLLILSAAMAVAQRVYLSTTITRNGSSLDVDLWIRNTSMPFVLGTSSFVMQYDSTVISSPEIVPANDGPWSSGDPDYLALSSVDHRSAGYTDLVVLFNGGGDNTGATVTATPTRIGTIRFTIVNAAADVVNTWRAIASVTQVTALGSPGVDLTYRDITDSCAFHLLDLKAILQGAYASGSMGTSLRSLGVLPQQQPYGTAPWLYAGAETVPVLPANVVDWVLVELRSGTSATSRIARQAALLRSDGTITTADSVPFVGFRGIESGSYYVVVRHRNHLAVMSSVPLRLTAQNAALDFTTGLAKYYGGDAKEVTSGVFALWAGDVSGNGIVKYSGAGNDRSPILTRIGGSDLTLSVSGYYNEDVTMNGQVKYSGTGNDRSIILQTIGGSDMTLTRSTNVPN